MNRLTLDTLMSGPQSPANPLVGRLLTAQEVDHIVGASDAPKCYGKQTGDYCEYRQQTGCDPYKQDCS